MQIYSSGRFIKARHAGLTLRFIADLKIKIKTLNLYLQTFGYGDCGLF
jgi:hypothetical protein